MKASTHRIAIPSILEVGKGNIKNVGNFRGMVRVMYSF